MEKNDGGFLNLDIAWYLAYSNTVNLSQFSNIPSIKTNYPSTLKILCFLWTLFQLPSKQWKLGYISFFNNTNFLLFRSNIYMIPLVFQITSNILKQKNVGFS